MKSLREEVKDIFDYAFDQYGINPGDFSDEQTDKVLKLIDKRIDEIRDDEDNWFFDTNEKKAIDKLKELLK